jgi:hypothetical protein
VLVLVEEDAEAISSSYVEAGYLVWGPVRIATLLAVKEGGPMLAEPVERSGVLKRAAKFHELTSAAGVSLVLTRFTVPEGEGRLVRNTDFMRAVADAQNQFRPESPGAQLVPEIAATRGHVVDNQKLSGLAGNGLPEWLRQQGVDTLWVTGVATNLTVEQTARPGTDLGFTAAKTGAFYQNDRLSSTRVHPDAEAQRATAAMGAQAMTIGCFFDHRPGPHRSSELLSSLRVWPVAL